MKSKKIIAAAIIVILIAGGLLYYEFGYNTGGKLNVSVADSAGPGVSAVFITFTGVDVHSTGGNNSSGWHNYNLTATTINIFNVNMTNPSFLSSLSLSAGKYTQIRLDITKVVATIGGVNATMTMASQYAIVIHPFTISSHTTTNMVIDFTLNPASMIATSQFNPVIGAVQVSSTSSLI
jgi:hypothetical protein